QVIIRNAKPFEWKHLAQPGPANGVAPGLKHTGYVVRNLWILKLSLFDNGADLFVAECHHTLVAPIPIKRSHLKKSGVGLIRFPLDELSALEFTNLRSHGTEAQLAVKIRVEEGLRGQQYVSVSLEAAHH